MSRLRDEYPMLPSYAAILQQQAAKVHLEERVHVGVPLDFGIAAPGALDGPPDGQEQQQEDCRIVYDQEETLIYI